MANLLRLKYLLLIPCMINVSYTGLPYTGLFSTKKPTKEPEEPEEPEELKQESTKKPAHTSSWMLRSLLGILAYLDNKKEQKKGGGPEGSFFDNLRINLQNAIISREISKFDEEKTEQKTLEERMKDLIKLLKTQYVPNKVIKIVIDKDLIQKLITNLKSNLKNLKSNLKELKSSRKQKQEEKNIKKIGEQRIDEISKDDEIIDIAVQKVVDLIIQIQTDMASEFIFEFNKSINQWINNGKTNKTILPSFITKKQTEEINEFSINPESLDEKEMNLIKEKVTELIDKIIKTIEDLISEGLVNKFPNTEINKILIKIINLIGLFKAKEVHSEIIEEQKKKEERNRVEEEEKNRTALGKLRKKIGSTISFKQENKQEENKQEEENNFLKILKNIMQEEISNELIYIILKRAIDIIEQELIEGTYTNNSITSKIDILRNLGQELMKMKIDNKILDNILQVATDKTAQKAIDMIQILKEKRVSDDQIYQTIGLISSSTQLTNASGLLNQVYWGLDLTDIPKVVSSWNKLTYF